MPSRRFMWRFWSSAAAWRCSPPRSGRSAIPSMRGGCGPSCWRASPAFRSACGCWFAPTPECSRSRSARSLPPTASMHWWRRVALCRRRPRRRCGGGLHRRSHGRPRRLFRRAAGGLDAASRLVEDGVARLLSALHRGRACRHHRRARHRGARPKGLVLLGLALPAMALGTLVGWNLYGRLDEKRFRQALATMLLLSGVLLIV